LKRQQRFRGNYRWGAPREHNANGASRSASRSTDRSACAPISGSANGRADSGSTSDSCGIASLRGWTFANQQL